MTTKENMEKNKRKYRRNNVRWKGVLIEEMKEDIKKTIWSEGDMKKGNGAKKMI